MPDNDLSAGELAARNFPEPAIDDEQVWVALTREQARTVRLALATQRRFYEEQLSSGIKGLALPGQERVSYTQRLQETIESQGAITLALADPGAV